MLRKADARESELTAPCEVEAQGTEDAAVEEQARVREWDVSHATPKLGTFARLTMAVPAITHVVANIGVAAPAIAGGYAIGKLGETLGVKKAVDSKAFSASVTAFLWSNGIFPNVTYEPFAEGGPPESDMSLTPLLVSNHTSYIDGLVLASVFKFPKIVAMSGSRKVPVIGKIMEEMDVVFVDRSNSNSRQATLDAISGHCSSWRPGGRPLLIFPEGTTSNGEGVLDFKKGAFVAGLPVRPVIMVYTGQWDPASTTYIDTGDGAEQTSDAEWAKQFVGHFVHSVHIRVLAPYIPNDEEKANPQVYAQNCQAHMSAAHKRVREEMLEKSWMGSAGRADGGMGYRMGDVSRSAYQRVSQSTLVSCISRGK